MAIRRAHQPSTLAALRRQHGGAGGSTPDRASERRGRQLSLTRPRPTASRTVLPGLGSPSAIKQGFMACWPTGLLCDTEWNPSPNRCHGCARSNNLEATDFVPRCRTPWPSTSTGSRCPPWPGCLPALHGKIRRDLAASGDGGDQEPQARHGQFLRPPPRGDHHGGDHGLAGRLDQQPDLWPTRCGSTTCARCRTARAA